MASSVKHLQETDQGGAVAAPLPTASHLTHQVVCIGVDTSSGIVQLEVRPLPVLASCPYCPDMFSDSISLRRHVKKKHLFRCSLCDRQFPEEIDLSAHMCMKPRRLPRMNRKLDHSYTPYRRDIRRSPVDLSLSRRSHRQTAGVNVATQEGTLAEARPSFSAEDTPRSLSSVVKSSQDSSSGRSFGDMSEIRTALSSLVKSSQDTSRGSGLGDVSEIRAALPAFPAALPQEHSSMELNEATGRRKYGLPEVFQNPFSGPGSSQDLSRGDSLGDMSGIRAALPAIPAASSQQTSFMELKETTGRMEKT